MSQAFVRESDEQWLHDIAPTIHALIIYLTRENNGIRVYEVDQYIPSGQQQTVYRMSNGMEYTHDENGRWAIL